MNIAIIFAGGVGKRLCAGNIPKQFLELYKKPIIVYTIEYFQKSKDIDEIYVACLEDWIDYMKDLVKEYKLTKVREVVVGGKTAQDSIYNALLAAKKNNFEDATVLIHDGVRPYITEKLIKECIDSVEEYGTAITTTPCYETIIVSEDSYNIKEVPFRKDTYAAQAPQAFHLGELIEAHDEMRRVNPEYINIVDACTLYRTLGRSVHLIRGNFGNIKVTTPEDYFQFKSLLECEKSIKEGCFVPPEMSEKLKEEMKDCHYE